MSAAHQSLLEKVARGIAKDTSSPPSSTANGSILLLAAGSYGLSSRLGEATMPTGFDPRAARLFEAIVEAAFLLANADQHFDDTERRALEQLVVHACGGAVNASQIKDLLSDLADQLAEDGFDRRLGAVAARVAKPEHKTEVLRIAALLAEASGGASDVERAALGRLALAFGLDDRAVDSALEAVKIALA